MGDDGDGCAFGEVAKHFAKDRQGRVFAATWAGLKDHRAIFSLGGGDIGAHVFPTERDKTRDGVTLREGRLQDVA